MTRFAMLALAAGATACLGLSTSAVSATPSAEPGKVVGLQA